jgi:hypothetical protein
MPEFYSKLLQPWNHTAWQLDLRAARLSVLNSLHTVTAATGQLLGEARPWASIDYTAALPNSLEGHLQVTAARPGTACGILAWFHTTLADGVQYSSGPGENCATVYGHLLFPWLEPVPVNVGDRVSVAIVASPSDSDYVWTWDSVVAEGATGREKARFRQSTFFGDPAFLPAALDASNRSGAVHFRHGRPSRSNLLI